MKHNQGKEIELSSGEIFRAISKNSSIYQAEVNGKICTYHNISDIASLSPIEEFVKKIIRTKEAGYIRKEKSLRDGTTAINFTDTKLSFHFKAINSFISTIQRHEEFYLYSENISLFQESCKELNLSANLFCKPGFYIYEIKKYEADLYNELIESIRAKSKTKEFKKKISNRITNANRMLKSINGYIDELFARYSRLLVLRIDLSYLVDINTSTGLPMNQVTLQQAKADFTKLKNNMRHNKLFKHLKGDVWKLEFGELKGFHYHLILFFLGSKVDKDVYYGAQIGEYWQKSITKNRGIFHNCNAEKKKYADLGILGIGMIDVGKEDSVELRFNLQNRIVNYLAKKEQILKTKLTSKEKVMGKGQVPERTSDAGRPRATNKSELL